MTLKTDGYPAYLKTGGPSPRPWYALSQGELCVETAVASATRASAISKALKISQLLGSWKKKTDKVIVNLMQNQLMIPTGISPGPTFNTAGKSPFDTGVIPAVMNLIPPGLKNIGGGPAGMRFITAGIPPVSTFSNGQWPLGGTPHPSQPHRGESRPAGKLSVPLKLFVPAE